MDNKDTLTNVNISLRDLSDQVRIATNTLAGVGGALDRSLGELNRGIESSVLKLTNEMQQSSKSADKHSIAMFRLTIALAIAALVQALSSFAQWKVSEVSIDEQREANSINRSNILYERMREDRLEQREVEWRRQDLELQKVNNKNR